VVLRVEISPWSRADGASIGSDAEPRCKLGVRPLCTFIADLR